MRIKLLKKKREIPKKASKWGNQLKKYKKITLIDEHTTKKYDICAPAHEVLLLETRVP